MVRKVCFDWPGSFSFGIRRPWETCKPLVGNELGRVGVLNGTALLSVITLLAHVSFQWGHTREEGSLRGHCYNIKTETSAESANSMEGMPEFWKVLRQSSQQSGSGIRFPPCLCTMKEPQEKLVSCPTGARLGGTLT